VRKKQTRLAVLGLAALALGAIVAPGSAQAAKVSEKADGGLVPPIVAPAVGPAVQTPFVQTFRLRGKKVTRKQITDVNVTVNGAGSGAASNLDLTALLVGPKGNSAPVPIPIIGSAMSNLEFDDQSILSPCNPVAFQSDDCNYLQGGDAGGDVGTMTGELGAVFNPFFRGGNPKGTWRLIWRDTNADAVTTTLGDSTLEVKTARKFAKEGK
jgi:hypothetical protein